MHERTDLWKVSFVNGWREGGGLLLVSGLDWNHSRWFDVKNHCAGYENDLVFCSYPSRDFWDLRRLSVPLGVRETLCNIQSWCPIQYLLVMCISIQWYHRIHLAIRRTISRNYYFAHPWKRTKCRSSTSCPAWFLRRSNSLRFSCFC